MSKFSEAFKQARKNKKGIFQFNGKYYNTRLKGEDIDNFRRTHKDYDAYIKGATDNWKTTDKTIDSTNKINHVPDPITTQPALEEFNPFGKYNFTELDIRNFGNVRNIYNAYLNSFYSPYNKDSYIGFLRDYFGNRFNGNLNENDFNKAMLEDFSMRGNIGGNDYKQGFGAFQGWLTAQKEKYLNNKNVPQNNIEPNYGGTDTRSQVVPGRLYGHKNGGIMYKYLLGGQMDPQLILTLVAEMLALDLGGTEQDAAQIMQSPEEFDNALSLVLSNMTGQDVTVDDNNRDLAIAEYVKAKLEQQVQTAKKGTKLDYLKSLRTFNRY